MNSEENSRTRPSAIILAAGKSERFGAPKVLQAFNGVPFITRIVKSLEQNGVERIILVLGYKGEIFREPVAAMIAVPMTINENYECGQFTSVQTGIAAIEASANNGTLICLIDQPHLATSTYQLLVETAMREPRKIILLTFQSRGGHPIYIPYWLFKEILAAPITTHLRHLLIRHVDQTLRLAVDDRAILEDIDTPADLIRLESLFSNR